MKESTPVKKLPYEKPAVVHRELIEAVAGVCDTADPTNGKADVPCTTLNS